MRHCYDVSNECAWDGTLTTRQSVIFSRHVTFTYKQDVMPKAVDNWTLAAAPTTPLQREGFMEACTQWMTSEPPDDRRDAFERPFALPTHADGGARPGDAAARAFVRGQTDDDVRDGAALVCELCSEGGSAAETVAGTAASSRARGVANPFTKQCYVVVCDACVTAT